MGRFPRGAGTARRFGSFSHAAVSAQKFGQPEIRADDRWVADIGSCAQHTTITLQLTVVFVCEHGAARV